jgi:hypothetical protein
MAVMCIYRGPGVTTRDYDNVRTHLQWEVNPPDGGLAHFISFDNGEAVEIDIWESRSAFRRYYNNEFEPACRLFGVRLDPPEVLELHAMAVAPAVEEHMVPRAKTRSRSLEHH